MIRNLLRTETQSWDNRVLPLAPCLTTTSINSCITGWVITDEKCKAQILFMKESLGKPKTRGKAKTRTSEKI